MTIGETKRRQRLFAPGVGFVVAYVLLVGNQWSTPRLKALWQEFPDETYVLVSTLMYPQWRLAPERFDSWGSWALNLQAVFFTGLMIAGLTRLARSPRGTGTFSAVVGTTVLSAALAALLSTIVTTALIGAPSGRTSWDYTGSDRLFQDFYVIPMSQGTFFGLLFGLLLAGIIALGNRKSPPETKRDTGPMSFW